MEGLFGPLQDQDVWTKPQQGTSQNKHKAGETNGCKMVASFPNSVGCVILGHSKGLGGKLTHLSLVFFGANCLPSAAEGACRRVLPIHLHSAEKDQKNVIAVGVLVELI